MKKPEKRQNGMMSTGVRVIASCLSLNMTPIMSEKAAPVLYRRTSRPRWTGNLYQCYVLRPIP